MKLFKQPKAVVQHKNKLTITITVPSHEMHAYRNLAEKYAGGDILEFTLELIRNSMKEFEDDFKAPPEVVQGNMALSEPESTDSTAS